MAFRQLTHKESMSHTILCLKANANKMYHLRIGEVVLLSTITRANENRSYKIYEELAMMLIKEAYQIFIKNNFLEIEFERNVFALDATTID